MDYPGATSQTGALKKTISAILELEPKIKNAEKLAQDLGEKVGNSVNKVFSTLRLQSTKEDGFSPKDKEAIKMVQNIKGATDRIADVGVGFIKKTFSLVEDIYAKLKAASPLLQAVENLFNLAWTLFFMPLGNKLAEELIPAVLLMMERITDLWSAFEGMTLGEAFAYAIKMGVDILGSFFMDIGSQLEEQGGFIGSIGHVLESIGSIIKYHGENLLNTLLNLATFLMYHIRELIATIIAFKVASLAMQTTLIWTVAVANSLPGSFGAGLATASTSASVMAAAIGTGASYGIGAAVGGAVYGLTAYADGGYVPATPGGQLAIIGEGGEGEYIVPESKLGQLGGNSYTLNFYGYNDDEFVNRVESVVSNQISQSRLRSGV